MWAGRQHFRYQACDLSKQSRVKGREGWLQCITTQPGRDRSIGQRTKSGVTMSAHGCQSLPTDPCLHLFCQPRLANTRLSTENNDTLLPLCHLTPYIQ